MKNMGMAALLAAALVLGSSFAPKQAQANWFEGTMAWYTSCMITHAPLFIQYNYTGAEASAYCWTY